MDVLVQKPKGQVKIWAIAGIIAIIVVYIFLVFIDVAYAKAYQGQLGLPDYFALFMNFNGLFITVILVFFIGLFASKKRDSFLKVILWIMMLVGLYYAMPSITRLIEFCTTYSGLELMYSLGLLLPSMLASALLVSAIIQKDSENKGVTNMIAWISIVVNVLLIVFQFVYIFSNAQDLSSFDSLVIPLSSTLAIVILTFLGFVFLAATKTVTQEKGKEAELDNLVEKIAQEPKQEEENPEDMVEKISRDDE